MKERINLQLFSDCNYKMIEKYILSLLLIVWTVFSTDLSNCEIKASHTGVLSSFQDSISNIQAGSVRLSSSLVGQNKRYIPFNITFSSSMKNNYDLATSIQNIYAYVPSVTKIDFQVSGVKRPSFFTAMFVIDSKAKWGFVSISYLVTTRNDFAAGNLIINNGRLLSPSFNNTEISFLLQVASKSGLNTNYAYSVPFISGMITYDQALKFQFTDCGYNASSNVLNVTLFTRYAKFPLQFLSISYIIFNMASQIEITSLFNISFVPVNVNSYLGVSSVENTARSSLQTNASATFHFGLESSPTQIEVFSQMFGIDGVIIQTQQSIDLLYLPMAENSSTTFNCISKSSCQSYGGYMVYTQSSVFEISSRCQVCGRYKVFNSVSGECVCASGFILQNGSCISIASTCPPNSTYNHTNQSCQCSSLFVNSSGKCVPIWQLCAPQEIYFSGKCIPISFNPTLHSCPLDYLNINRTCVAPKKCLQPLVLNKLTNQCECPNQMHLVDGKCESCPENETWVNNKCTCKLQYFRINGICLKCGANAYFDGKKCVCLRLFDGDGFNCTPTAKKKASLPSLPGSLAGIIRFPESNGV